MAKFQGFGVSAPSFGGGQYRRGNATGIFQQILRNRQNIAAERRQRQYKVKDEETIRARMKFGESLARTRSEEAESRKKVAAMHHNANVLFEETELQDFYLEALSDPKRSPIVKNKLPLRYIDESTKHLDDDQLQAYLFKNRAGMKDEMGKPTEAGKALLKTYNGEQSFDSRDMTREAEIVRQLVEEAQRSDFPTAAMEALTNVVERIENDFNAVPTMDQAIDRIVSRTSLNVARALPTTTRSESGPPGAFDGFTQSNIGIDRTEDSQINAGQNELDQPRTFTVDEFDAIDPAILGESSALRSAAQEGMFSLSYTRGEDERVTGVQVISNDPAQTAAADVLTERILKTQSTIERSAGVAVNRGLTGESDVGDMGAAVTSPGAAAAAEPAPTPEPKPESWIEKQRRKITGGE